MVWILALAIILLTSRGQISLNGNYSLLKLLQYGHLSDSFVMIKFDFLS